jgi:hypothetical protein
MVLVSILLGWIVIGVGVALLVARFIAAGKQDRGAAAPPVPNRSKCASAGTVQKDKRDAA